LSVRLTYIDEAGISSVKQEPYLVVAAVVIDADAKMVAVEKHLDDLVHKHIPEPDREGFIFHASHIWSGLKYFAGRDTWPWERRAAILKDLAAVPQAFGLSIGFGLVDRAAFNSQAGDTHRPGEVEAGAHALAFAHCSITVDVFMRANAPKEITVLIAEDREQVRSIIKEVQAFLRDRKQTEAQELVPWMFPLTHIRDTIHFAKKAESKLLQIADFCAFTIKGHFMKKEKGAPLFAAIEPCLILNPALGPSGQATEQNFREALTIASLAQFR
jgi:hypothetical protein